jgi:hypothetical protein
MKLINGVLEIWNKVISPVISYLVDYLGPTFSVVFNTIVDIVGTCIALVSDILEGVIQVIGGIIDFIVGVFTGNWRKAWQGVIDIFYGIFKGLAGLIKAPLNLVIDLVNAAIGGINTMIVKINKVPGVNVPSIPEIPKLARGGIVDSATLSIIGEAGKEAVVPLENNKGGLRELASLLLAEMGPRSSNNDSFGDGDLILMIDSSVIGKVALSQLRKMQRQGNITLIPT